ncbi:MAG: nicotinate-nucleotide--dimethylbenzimidazole phosphoribosyltransferase [Lachnospiraceae bacterium]|nr:nicotinate-nucleotide--dimethylbenzimidazole phosphoribosyltransferase [Lachnospiraceae bacterium]
MKKNWDQHSKPIDGFGDFEDAICRIAAIMGEEVPQIHRRALVVMIADNGVIQEQVSQVGAEVTLGVARNLGDGISTASVLAKGSHTDVFPIDIGIASDEKIPGVICRKVARGTKNLRREAAMTEEQVLQAISVGIQTVFELKEKGYTILATGEMGIGNTTTSAALLCALTGCDPKAVTGRGAGLSDEGLLRKRQVVEDGVNSYQRQATHLPAFSPEGTLFALSRLGGLDIAGLTGVFIGGALYHVPIIIDGLISAVSALCAERFCPGCKDYMLASHSGREGGCEMARKELGLTSYLTGNMALGEGTGALLLFPLLDNILYYYTHGSMFEATKIRAYERFDEEAEERT